MCVVYQDVFFCDSVFTDLHHLESESLLNQSVFVVLAEDKRLSVLYINGILLASFLIIYRVVASVVEDDTVLENFTNRCPLVLICCLQDLYCFWGICSY